MRHIILLKLTNSHTYTLKYSLPFRLQLLNTTVASIALFVNSVLTQTYHAIYGSGDDEEELILVVAPLAANKEIEDLYKANLIDFESAMCVFRPHSSLMLLSSSPPFAYVCTGPPLCILWAALLRKFPLPCNVVGTPRHRRRH